MKIETIRKISGSRLYLSLKKNRAFNEISARIGNIVLPTDAIVRVKPNNSMMRLHPKINTVERALYIRNVHEPEVTREFKKLIKKVDVVIDVGANIGYYSLMARGVKEVHAFEPDDYAYSILVENVKMNGCRNITEHCIGVSDVSDIGVPFYKSRDSGGNSLSARNAVSERKTTIRTTTLDDYFGKSLNGKRVLMKSDTQGAEMKVITGALKLIRNTDMALILEIWDDGLKNMGSSQYQLLETMRKLGFEWRMVGDCAIFKRVVK